LKGAHSLTEDPGSDRHEEQNPEEPLIDELEKPQREAAHAEAEAPLIASHAVQ